MGPSWRQRRARGGADSPNQPRLLSEKFDQNGDGGAEGLDREPSRPRPGHSSDKRVSEHPFGDPGFGSRAIWRASTTGRVSVEIHSDSRVELSDKAGELRIPSQSRIDVPRYYPLGAGRPASRARSRHRHGAHRAHEPPGARRDVRGMFKRPGYLHVSNRGGALFGNYRGRHLSAFSHWILGGTIHLSYSSHWENSRFTNKFAGELIKTVSVFGR